MSQTDGTGDEVRRFRAFLSYSHADSAMAGKLHRKLEAYRLPRRLRAANSDGKLGTIFRDREDFPAAQDLSQSVKEALGRSDALVVLCSPDAAASPWVGREIALFRELNPDRPVLAAILRGEPEKAFPPALTALGEPLAADLRGSGDGAKLGFLKVVAGVAGVSLDALVQRDAQRRLRRVIVVTGAAVAATLVMALMTVFALQARDEAQAQRAEAEGLIEYMLTDLRGTLRGVGRLDAMEGVNDRAMVYYEAQGDLSRLPDASLQRRARVLHAMGEDELSRKDGTLETARAMFAEAHRVTGDLLAREPQDGARIYTHAQSEYWVGHAAYRHGDWAKVRAHYTRYLDYARQLTAIDPNDVKWLREEGYAYGNICQLDLEEPGADRSQAAHNCAEALEVMERIAQNSPDDEQSIGDLVNRLNWYGQALERDGDDDEREAAYRRAETIIARLVKRDPRNTDFRDNYLATQIALAEFEHARGARDAVAKRLKKAKQTARDLTAIDPQNARWATLRARIAALEDTMQFGSSR